VGAHGAALPCRISKRRKNNALQTVFDAFVAPITR
jgi:hypothetical protein